MVINWQRDPRWINTWLGVSNTTIGQNGCTISVIGNIIGVDPTIVNDRMKAVGGFLNGNLVIWAKIEEAFPGIKIRRVWSYDNADVLANVPNVIVEVPAAPIGGAGSHWVQFLGNHRLNDPWTGQERATSDFPNPTGYCVITGKWVPPVSTDALNACLSDREKFWKERDALQIKLDAANKQLTDMTNSRNSLQDKINKAKTDLS